MQSWPEWWTWPLELSPHLLKRMTDRQFTEVELRSMLEDAKSYHVDVEPGRYLIATRHDSLDWEVIVEPVSAQRVLLVITAYPVN